MKTIKITWDILIGDSISVKYYFNQKFAGINDEGFKTVLKWIKNDTRADEIFMRGRSLDNTGGKSLHESVPFYHHWEELQSVIGNRKLRMSVT